MQFLKRLKPMTLMQQNSTANTIYVDTDTEQVVVGRGASGTTERVLFSSGTDGNTGHLLFTPDNTYDIGASGATRPRNGYFANNLQVGAGGLFQDAARGSLSAAADGIWTFKDAAGTSFTRLQFGGTTASFPSIKRSGTALHFVLADDSGPASIGSVNNIAADGFVIAGNGTAIPAGGTAAVRVGLTSTTTFGVYAGSGVPTVTAAKGSLYLRSDGSSTTTRAYINTDGGTTWTALTTVA